MELTENEKELIRQLRNLQNSKHNTSWILEFELNELFEKLKRGELK